MRLVDSKHPHQHRRDLTADEAAAVRRFCGAGQEARSGDVALVESVLEEMHDGRFVRQWLECDCVSVKAVRPTMTARIRGDDGPRHFVRMHQYGAHECNLALFRKNPEPDEGADDDATPPGQHNPLEPVSDALDYLDNLHDGVTRPRGSTTSAGGTGSKGRRLPRLGRILYTLLEDAGITTAAPEVLARNIRWWELLPEYASLQALSSELSLSQVLYFEPWINIEKKMTGIDALHWPALKARSALLLFVAHEIREGAAIMKTSLGERVVRPEKGIRIGGRDQALSQPPYWVLAVVDRDHDGKARFREAFAQHAYSAAQPIPLDSRYERITLKLLFRAMEWVRKRGVAVTLEKPLFDRPVRQKDGSRLWCRPDFELTFRTQVVATGSSPRLHRIVIETMGADEPEYLDRKVRTHVIMKRRGILVEHRVSDDGDQDERDKKFYRRVVAKILQLAGL